MVPNVGVSKATLRYRRAGSVCSGQLSGRLSNRGDTIERSTTVVRQTAKPMKAIQAWLSGFADY